MGRPSDLLYTTKGYVLLRKMLATKKSIRSYYYTFMMVVTTLLLSPFSGVVSADGTTQFSDYCDYYFGDENGDAIDTDYENDTTGNPVSMYVSSDEQYIHVSCDQSTPNFVVIATIFEVINDGSSVSHKYVDSSAFYFSDTPAMFPVNLSGAGLSPVSRMLAWTIIDSSGDTSSTGVNLYGHSHNTSSVIEIEDGIEGHFGDDQLMCSKGLDVAFVIDDTGSMGSYIGNIKSEVQSIADTISNRSHDNFRYSLWTFKDHPQLRHVFDENNNVSFSENLSTLYASGGGDWPEGSSATMISANDTLEWRNDSGGRIMMMITDAPPRVSTTTAMNNADLVAENDIRIASIHVGNSMSFAPLMRHYAETSSGVYAHINSPSRTAQVMSTIVDAICMDETSIMTPITAVSEIDEVVIFEQTGLTYTHQFAMSGNTLEKLHSDVDEGNGEYDFSSVVSERYDVYISDHRGNVDENGSFLTIDSYYHGVNTNNGAAMNIDAVGLRLTNNTTVWANSVTNVEIGEGLSGMHYATHGFATRILGESDDLSTRLGNDYSTITVGFEDLLMGYVPPVAPTAENLSLVTEEDLSLDITLIGADEDSASISYIIESMPENGTLSGEGANLTYTPSPNWSGNDNITYRTDDGLLSSSIATVDILVTPVNDAPVAHAITLLTTMEDTPIAVNLSAHDADGDSLSYTVNLSGELGVLTGDAPNFTYTPKENISDVTDTLEFNVSDGELSSETIVFSIHITSVNDAPVGGLHTLWLEEDTNVSVFLNGSDIDGDSITFNILSMPSNGVLSGIIPELVYTPNANFSGNDSFTYEVLDGTTTSGSITVNITVAEMPEPLPPEEEAGGSEGNSTDGAPISGFSVPSEDNETGASEMDELSRDGIGVVNERVEITEMSSEMMISGVNQFSDSTTDSTEPESSSLEPEDNIVVE